MKARTSVSKSNFDFLCQYRTYTSEINAKQMHYHQHYEILYVVAGEMEVIFENGYKYILNQSNIMLIPPNVIHNMVSYSKIKQSIIIVNASKKFVDLLLLAHREEIFECFEYGVIQMDAVTKQNVLKNLMKLRDNNLNEDVFSEKNKIPFLNIVYELTEFVTNNKTLNKKQKMPNVSYITEVQEYIIKNIGSDLSLLALSDRFNKSREHLSRQFKKETGTSISEYITLHRMITARRLIEENTMSIEKIALMVGYASLSHFDKMFKKHKYNHGLTPTEYYNAHTKVCNANKEKNKNKNKT